MPEQPKLQARKKDIQVMTGGCTAGHNLNIFFLSLNPSSPLPLCLRGEPLFSLPPGNMSPAWGRGFRSRLHCITNRPWLRLLERFRLVIYPSSIPGQRSRNISEFFSNTNRIYKVFSVLIFIYCLTLLFSWPNINPEDQLNSDLLQ